MVTRVAIHLRPHQRSRDVGAALSAGFARHGVTASLSTDEEPPRDVYLAVVWGAHQRSLWAGYRARGVPILVAEQGYVGDRDRWTSMGWNGLHGYADAWDNRTRSDRWEQQHATAMQPWRMFGEAVVIMGQMPGDAAVRVPSLMAWYEQMVRQVRSVTDLPIVFRPHPLRRVDGPVGVRRAVGSLEDVLSRAALVVTHTSTVGVQAALAGVPVVATDRGSMAYPVASAVVSPEAFTHRPDRSAWAHDLAYRQWISEEIASGEAWEYLRHRLDGQRHEMELGASDVE